MEIGNDADILVSAGYERGHHLIGGFLVVKQDIGIMVILWNAVYIDCWNAGSGGRKGNPSIRFATKD